MKYSELTRLLKKHGWIIAREGRKHTIYQKMNKEIIVPRHPSKEVPKGTCIQIMKQAGIKQV